MARASATGLFGKVPAHAEFIRVRTGDPSAQALVTWLEEGSEAAARAGRSLGAEPVRFLFSPPDIPQVLVGAVVGSSDRVGRCFPLAAFTAADSSGLAATFPALPRAARPFLDATASLLDDAKQLGAQEVAARVESLPQWEEELLSSDLASLRGSAAATPVRETLGSLVGDLAAGQPWYALHCFLTACQPLRGRDPGGAGVVLDCPAHDDVDRFAWLDLARCLLRWHRPPSFFWTEAPAGRLLIALGSPPAVLLRALWHPSRHEAKVWPLTTEKPEAIAAAQRALGPSVLGVFERPSASIMDLLAALEP